MGEDQRACGTEDRDRVGVEFLAVGSAPRFLAVRQDAGGAVIGGEFVEHPDGLHLQRRFGEGLVHHRIGIVDVHALRRGAFGYGVSRQAADDEAVAEQGACDLADEVVACELHEDVPATGKAQAPAAMLGDQLAGRAVFFGESEDEVAGLVRAFAGDEFGDNSIALAGLQFGGDADDVHVAGLRVTSDWRMAT